MKYYKEIERTDECGMWCRRDSTTNEKNWFFWGLPIVKSSDLAPELRIRIIKNIFDGEGYPIAKEVSEE